MPSLQWLPGQRIQVPPPKKPKKITGTRFAAIMGLNKWNTEFKTWCEITKTWQEPFVDTIYTKAGKVIEHKQAEYMRKAYGMTDLVTPEDKFGKDYFKRTYGDFFPNYEVFGGMWDYLVEDELFGVQTVLEMKTTQRSEDWKDDVPEYYAMQAALYAWMLGVDDVIMVCSFLEDKDYEHPENYEPSASNTITVPFKVSERYPNMDELVSKAVVWWVEHVEGGISPAYDAVADAAIIKELRSLHPDKTSSTLNDLLNEGADIQRQLEEYKTLTDPLEKRLKAIKEAVKEDAMPQFSDQYDKVYYTGNGADYKWTVTRSTSIGLDEEAMKADGVWEKYHTKQTTSIKLTMTKEDK